MITYDDFLKVDIRVGKVIEVLDFPEAHVPSYKIKIDFGEEIGVKQSCGRFPANYTKDDLLGKLVSAVVNFPPKKIGPEISEVLVLGFPDENNQPVLIIPERNVSLGGKLF